jgi:hypothetical protein
MPPCGYFLVCGKFCQVTVDAPDIAENHGKKKSLMIIQSSDMSILKRNATSDLPLLKPETISDSVKN